MAQLPLDCRIFEEYIFINAVKITKKHASQIKSARISGELVAKTAKKILADGVW
jgi:hypothetical protein